MFEFDALREIVATMSKNRLRTILTACGVFWGMFMLIVLLGLGSGLQGGAQRNLGSMVKRSIFIGANRTTMSYRGLSPGRYVALRDADTDALERLPGVEKVAPRLQLGEWRDGGNIVYGSKSGVFSVMGDRPDFLSVESLRVREGRFVNDRDVRERRKVAVMGSHVHRVLFGEAVAIGEYIMVQGLQFQVVGLVHSDKGGPDGERIDNTVFIPFSTFQQAFNKRDRVGWFALAVGETAPVKAVEDAARQLLVERHRIHPQDKQAFWAFNAAEKAAKFEALFRGIRLFVWCVGVLTLLAGVLGVSNILLITVKERTREIGVRKALGAAPSSIVGMILKEAVALTSFAGYLGLVAGVGALEMLSLAVQHLPHAPLVRPEVHLDVALWALLVLVVSGVVAGVVPARHAAGISPVEALRSE